jgi:hypothetical protein
MTKSLMQNVDANVSVGLVGVAEAQEKTNGIQVPLEFFHFNATLVENVAHEHIDHDDPEQYQPDVGDGVTNPIRYSVNPLRPTGMR